MTDPNKEYTLTAQVQAGESGYLENTLAIAVQPTSDATDATLALLKDDALDAFGNPVTCLKVGAGEIITPVKGKCYELEFTGGEISTYTINVSAPAQMQGVAVLAKNPAVIDYDPCDL